jgi:hypothetical protein
VPALQGEIVGVANPSHYIFDLTTNDAYRLMNLAWDKGIRLLVDAMSGTAPRHSPSGALSDSNTGARNRVIFAGSSEIRTCLEDSLRSVPVRVNAVGTNVLANTKLVELRRPKLALYQPWLPSMDEGWTRLVLENFGFRYTTVRNADVISGKLRTRFDVIVLPSMPPRAIRDGAQRVDTAPEFAGGLGVEGAEALRAFVEEGGVLVALEDSSTYVIDEFRLPIRNAVSGLRTSEFYGPGSIVRATAAKGHPVTVGYPREISVYFDRSMAFEWDPTKVTGTETLVSYSQTDTLRSGWLLGASKIQGKAAVVAHPVGEGKLILFGFPPQHRGQTHGTFRLLFNAIVRGGGDPETPAGQP